MKTLFLALALILAAGASAQVSIDATSVPPGPTALSFPVGGRSPDGRILSANSRFLMLNGHPWFPVMGEFHYSRYPVDEWEPELLKMKAGGITIVSAYVFWIHHEEAEGHFDWSGARDLRRFVELCGRDGLLVWVRIGPWAHGEVRNGGFPDWLVSNVAHPRSNDPDYLRYVTRFYGEIGRQLRGLFWQDGGPIAGMQIENEYHPQAGGPDHMLRLLSLARAAGIDAPLVSATGWDRATLPAQGFLPVFGGYTEQFWSESLKELPPNQNFFFTPIRAEDNVMGDLQPKNPGYASRYAEFPFLTAEMGGGMAIAYHRRPLMHAEDSTAAALVKLGSGVSLLGYYLYHGGTNPDGHTSLEETQLAWNGYNDMEAKSYDFQAPLGEFGQVRESYRTMKLLHLFLGDYGRDLAPMPAFFPKSLPSSLNDVSTPRLAARTDGRRGFLFINNYERNRRLDDHPDLQVDLQLPSERLEIPRQPTFLPSGAYTVWPFNLDIGGVTLRYATAELICRLDEPLTYVFFAWEGTTPEFAFDTEAGDLIEAPGARIWRDRGVTVVDALAPGTASAIRVTRHNGTRAQIIVLTHAQALGVWKTTLGGRDRLLLSGADLYFAAEHIHLATRDPHDLAVGIYPSLDRTPAGWRLVEREGVFTEYRTGATSEPELPVEVSAVKAAEPASPVRLSGPPRAVAMEPSDSDFDRAAVWNLTVPAAARTGPGRNFLEISYAGDVARLYANGRFLDDNFYKGPPWELGAWRLASPTSGGPLTVQLKILPLRADAPLFLEAEARAHTKPAGDTLELKKVFLVHEYDSEMDVNPP